MRERFRLREISESIEELSEFDKGDRIIHKEAEWDVVDVLFTVDGEEIIYQIKRLGDGKPEEWTEDVLSGIAEKYDDSRSDDPDYHPPGDYKFG